MFKFIAFFACLAVAAAAPGLIAQTHSIVQPAAYIDTSASSAITHQSNVNLVRKIPVAPLVHAAPLPVPAAVVKTVVPAVAAVPVVKAVHAAPVLHSAPIISTYAVATPVVHSAYPVVHSVPLVKTVAAVAPVTHYTAIHK
ncbi:uncharacterized protein Dwil_GK16561 [Drosophila willistoni]|uniref:Uncharacterized protein n=1 Tax=Drosophila willistoni TaxID=7260 RepID=B4MN55_DROWI|nr:cuticle protein 19.8 [Drosophila willistoni]EDW73611.1 uncharacterized protein Dwil_GK16561 [Drosophila willistoni]